jgi:hypothetical protein
LSDNIVYAFLDESGDTSLDFKNEGVSTHFAVTAILVEKNALEVLDEKLEDIRKKHFQTGEMKSSKVGSNDIRRIQILHDLKELNFRVFAVVVDKKQIWSQGLAIKSSFFKYMYSLVHRRLFGLFPELIMFSDEHGRKEFMDGFREYVHERHVPNLFGSYKFYFAKSHNNRIIQLADLIGGTIALGFDEKRKSPKYRDFMKLLKGKVLDIEEWPRAYSTYLIDIDSLGQSRLDSIIAETAINLAVRFLVESERRKNLDPETQEQVALISFLLYNISHIDAYKYVSTREILDNLKVRFGKNFDRRTLRQEIVARLRDKGLIIASSRTGYKIPVCERDIYSFVNHGSSIIMPMLQRLKACRKQLYISTRGEFDILEKDEFSNLKAILGEPSLDD